mmetsp:Transcript_100313/g.289651  ORF Transcript_100313/g.289651 Transcript_100313/m.289651 type:complete len:219 (-) Transcript_100313:10-666(-)
MCSTAGSLTLCRSVWCRSSTAWSMTYTRFARQTALRRGVWRCRSATRSWVCHIGAGSATPGRTSSGRSRSRPHSRPHRRPGGSCGRTPAANLASATAPESAPLPGGQRVTIARGIGPACAPTVTSRARWRFGGRPRCRIVRSTSCRRTTTPSAMPGLSADPAGLRTSVVCTPGTATSGLRPSRTCLSTRMASPLWPRGGTLPPWPSSWRMLLRSLAFG